MASVSQLDNNFNYQTYFLLLDTLLRFIFIDVGFWFNVNSDSVRPLGWGRAVGIPISNVPKNTIFPLLPLEGWLLPPYYPNTFVLQKRMAFEVIHPFHIHRIATGYVEEVYKHGYFLALIECNPPLLSKMQFVFHVTSPWLLPCGFSAQNGIELAVPSGEKENNFSWTTFCTKNKMQLLDLSKLGPVYLLNLFTRVVFLKV